MDDALAELIPVAVALTPAQEGAMLAAMDEVCGDDHQLRAGFRRGWLACLKEQHQWQY